MFISWTRLLWAISIAHSTVAALDLPFYPGLRINQSQPGALEVSFNNAPINAWGPNFLTGLSDIVQKLRNDNGTKVVLFKSDVPRWFASHLDLTAPIGESGCGNFHNCTQLTRNEIRLLVEPAPNFFTT